MFPLRDENPTESRAVVTVAILLANIAVWFYVQGGGSSEAALLDSVCRYGAIPAEISGRTGEYAGVELAPGYRCAFGGASWVTLLTSMFMHGSWLHLIGNMWFLWIFANNIEDTLGHVRFAIFYVVTGVTAAATHIVLDPASPVPMVGASGAISGVMGGYLLLFPRVRIQTLFVIFIFVRILPIPAWLVLLEWFGIQLLIALTPEAGAGVAFWAHIGGFVAGVLLIKPFHWTAWRRRRRRFA
ncbi:MAG TPA: rhomboid family intramembrane serine protease [Longimicrobiales bacterium]|nr:rhomboid family intramembrane serine protease [Longimicrobiales bacterium]